MAVTFSIWLAVLTVVPISDKWKIASFVAVSVALLITVVGFLCKKNEPVRQCEVGPQRVRDVIDHAVTLLIGAPDLHPLQAMLLAGAANLSSNEDVVAVNNDLSNRGSGSALNDTAIRREDYLSFLKFSAKERLQLRNRVEIYEATRLYYLQPLSASISREQCFDNAARLLKTFREYLDSFNAIYCAQAAELGSNEEVVWVSNQLKEHGYDHPFTAIHVYVPTAEWLDFVRWGRHHAKYNFERDNDYLTAAQEWSKLKGHKQPSKAVENDFEIYKAMHKRLE